MQGVSLHGQHIEHVQVDLATQSLLNVLCFPQKGVNPTSESIWGSYQHGTPDSIEVFQKIPRWLWGPLKHKHSPVGCWGGFCLQRFQKFLKWVFFFLEGPPPFRETQPKKAPKKGHAVDAQTSPKSPAFNLHRQRRRQAGAGAGVRAGRCHHVAAVLRAQDDRRGARLRRGDLQRRMSCAPFVELKGPKTQRGNLLGLRKLPKREGPGQKGRFAVN